MIDARDMRVPVVAGDAAQAGADDLVQPLFATGAAEHPAGCTCCRPRPPFAAALARRYLERARGEIRFFVRVFVPCAPEQDVALAAALAADPVTAARYRFAGRLRPQGGSASSPSPSANCM